MKGFIPEDRIEEIKSRVDVVKLVSEYVTLKKAGRNWIGLCPFHQEKTPSFTVSADKQIFYCFGCGEGGNAVTFLMKVNHLTFPEAIRSLAGRVGVSLPERPSTPQETARRGLREALYEVNRKAAAFFRQALAAPAGRSARDYLAERGIPPEAVQAFGVGYAPGGWTNLRDHLAREKVSLALAEQAGLLASRTEDRGGTDRYDRFRGRVMFPIAEAGGRLVAFGGRLIEDGEPKYLNSPESMVYTKGRHLYGLSVTKEEIRRRGFAVLVEGYVDLISLWSAGVRNVVASLGTALTAEQVGLLRRFTGRVVVAFDPDEAGRKALARSLPLFLAAKIPARALVLPGGADPDRFVRIHGREAFEEQARLARSLVDYYIDEMIGQGDSVEERRDALQEAVTFVSHIDDDIARNLFVKRVSEKLGIDQELLKAEVQRFLPARAPARPVLPPPDRVHAVELGLVHVMLEKPESIREVIEAGVLACFQSRELRAAGEALAALWQRGGAAAVRPAGFVHGLAEGPLKQRLLECLVEGLPQEEALLDRIVADTIRQIQRRWFRQQHRLLRIRLQEAQERGDAALCERLLREKEGLLEAEKGARRGGAEPAS